MQQTHRKTHVPLILGSILLLNLLFSVGAEPLHKQVSPGDRRKAVRKGIDFLLSRQLVDGSWASWTKSKNDGLTAFTLYTLNRCGLPRDHPSLLRGYAFLSTTSSRSTYSLASSLMAFATSGNKGDLPRIKKIARQLIAQMPDSGLYDYPGLKEDLSNSLFVGFALDLAVRRGVSIPSRIWQQLLQGTLSCFVPVRNTGDNPAKPRGFSYQAGGNPSGSMTSAGITLLHLCSSRLETKLSKRKQDLIERTIATALDWLDHRFTLTKNPPNRAWHYFHLWGFERIGSLLQLDRIGDHDWYREGSEMLLANQHPEGNWHYLFDGTTFDPGKEQLADLRTCLALLFLSRATTQTSSGSSTKTYHVSGEPDAFTLRAAGDTPLTVWVESADPSSTSVEYYRCLENGTDQETLIGSSDNTSDGFAIQVRFPHNSRWKVRCVIVFDQGRTASLHLVASVELVSDPAQLRYATDSTRNLLFPRKCTVKASSSANKNRRPAFVTDRLQGRFWECHPTDSTPWIEVQLDKAVGGREVLFSHARNDRTIPGIPRAKRIRVTINRRKKFELTLPARPDRKCILRFSKRTSVTSIRVELLDTHHGEMGKVSLGLGEIEVLP